MPGRVLQYFLTKQMLRFCGGLTFGHKGLGKRNAREPTLVNACCVQVSAKYFTAISCDGFCSPGKELKGKLTLLSSLVHWGRQLSSVRRSSSPGNEAIPALAP